MQRLFFLALLLLPLYSAHAAVPAYTLLNNQSTLEFTATQNGAPLKGSFTDFTAKILFDANQLDQSSIEVTVMTGSVKVSADDVLKYLRMPNWLGVEAFPQAVFKSNKITHTNQLKNYMAEGTLQIRDKTAPATLQFQLVKQDAKNAEAIGDITLHRNDFGIGQGEWSQENVVKNDVQVHFYVVADKQ